MCAQGVSWDSGSMDVMWGEQASGCVLVVEPQILGIVLEQDTRMRSLNHGVAR